jgi:hypothetical protein
VHFGVIGATLVVGNVELLAARLCRIVARGFDSSAKATTVCSSSNRGSGGS